MRSIRHCEDRALIASARSPAGQRYVEQDTVERVLLIRQLLAAGLATRAIADALPCLSQTQVPRRTNSVSVLSKNAND